MKASRPSKSGNGGRRAAPTGDETTLTFSPGASLQQIAARLDAGADETKGASLLLVPAADLENAVNDLENAETSLPPYPNQTRASQRAERIASRLGMVYGYYPQRNYYWFRREQKAKRL